MCKQFKIPDSAFQNIHATGTQHTEMESRLSTVVRRDVQSAVDKTSLGKDLERSQPAQQHFVSANSLDSDMLTVE